MSVRVAINGFGRIGRNVLRAIAEADRDDIEVVAINDLAPVETNAHLLRFDSVHGRFPREVKVVGDSISVGNGMIKVTAIKDPATLPWKQLGIDIALECTGIFTSKEKAAAHLAAGAKRVIVSAPADGADLTVVYGVNHDKLTKEQFFEHLDNLTVLELADYIKEFETRYGISAAALDRQVALKVLPADKIANPEKHFAEQKTGIAVGTAVAGRRGSEGGAGRAEYPEVAEGFGDRCSGDVAVSTEEPEHSFQVHPHHRAVS